MIRVSPLSNDEGIFWDQEHSECLDSEEPTLGLDCEIILPTFNAKQGDPEDLSKTQRKRERLLRAL